LSAAAWAFRWLWDQPGVTVVLSGMNGAEQLAENLKTAETAAPGMLSERERAAFAPAVLALREAYRIPCTGCDYCMPCPQGVNIPGCFAAYNATYAMGFVVGMQQYLTGTGANHAERRSAGGRSCVKCGACEKKCPQHIEIPRALETVTKRMEPFWFNAMLAVVRRVLS
jgi:predicted aldo/keto reductase-like oxidoreductase